MNNLDKNSYYLHKNSKNKEIIYMEYSKLDGLNISPKTNNQHIVVNKMIIISPNFVSKLLRKKITKKLEYLIEKLKKILFEDGEDEGNVSLLLDECEKLKAYAINNMDKLEMEFVNNLFGKIDLIYEQIRKYQINISNNYNQGKSR